MPLIEKVRADEDFDRISNHLLDDATLSIQRFENMAPYRNQSCEDAAGAYHDFATTFDSVVNDIEGGRFHEVRLAAQVVCDWETDLIRAGDLQHSTLARYKRVALKVRQLVELLSEYVLRYADE